MRRNKDGVGMLEFNKKLDTKIQIIMTANRKQ